MPKPDHTTVHLRVPSHLLKQIKIACAENARSMNAELLARLERSFASDDEDRAKAARLLTEALSLLDKGARG